MKHPRDVLLGAQAAALVLPVCDHYSGVEVRMRKSLQLQAELHQEFGVGVMDVTLDCEDGAPVGGEHAHAELVAHLADSAHPSARVAVRVHAVDHPAFEQDVAILVGQASSKWCHIMLPKVESVNDIHQAMLAIDAAGGAHLPLHALIESPLAVHNAFDIAAHPRVQSLSFGLMDFVSAHAGAVPASAMGVSGQFSHPMVVHAKLAIASACHAHGKTPSHCVVTEFNDANAMQNAASRAAHEFGFTRMWSIHPSQVRPILAAFSPATDEVAQAADILQAAVEADWAPIQQGGQLHDRASYRFFWSVLERAHATGQVLPAHALGYFQP
ncbi:MAG: CoA ester lyase [Betaproteobacteria bacterium]|nr:CoA ester lyase [Betaproteobacteria bacterium]